MSFENPSERVIAFETAIGWCAVAHCDGVLGRVIIGVPSQQDLFEQLVSFGAGPREPNEVECGWVDSMVAYLNGELDPVTGSSADFRSFRIDESWMTDFQRRCVRACRDIPLGQTVSYGGLAEKIGAPKAARAVGTVMRKNRYPLIVPCHRVVAANGMGGFNAPTGIALKARLLELDRHLSNRAGVSVSGAAVRV